MDIFLTFSRSVAWWLVNDTAIANAQLREFDLVGRIFASMGDQEQPRSPKTSTTTVDKPQNGGNNIKIVDITKTTEKSTNDKKQDGGPKPSTSASTSRTSTSSSRPRASSSRASSAKTQSTGSKEAADVLTKAMAMFNDLSSSISSLSVQMKEIDKRQDDLERKRKSRSDDSDMHTAKRQKHAMSDCDSPSEGELRDSDDEFSAEIMSLLGPDKPSDSNNQSDQPDKWLDQFEAEFVDEEIRAPPVSDKLAHLVNGILAKKAGEDKIKTKMDAFPAPENIQGLITPKVNPEVWGKLKTETRSRDVKLQKAQVRLTRGMTAMVKLGEKITTAQRDNKPLDLHDSLKITLNAIALVANGNFEISLRRRDFIRPDLNTSYRDLCSTSTPITDMLFGDDLPKIVKDINETNRMASKFSSHRGYNRNSYKNKNSYPREGYKKYNNNNSYNSKNGQSSSFKKGKRGGGAGSSNGQPRR